MTFQTGSKAAVGWTTISSISPLTAAFCISGVWGSGWWGVSGWVRVVAVHGDSGFYR